MSQVTAIRDLKKHTYTFTFGAAVQSVAAEIDPKLGIKGEVIKLIIKLPDWANTVTAVVSMNNEDGDEVFADDARNQDDDYNVTLDRNECIILGQKGEEFVMTLSGVPGDIEDATVVAYVEG